MRELRRAWENNYRNFVLELDAGDRRVSYENGD
jgi:hypothetical protein